MNDLGRHVLSVVVIALAVGTVGATTGATAGIAAAPAAAGATGPNDPIEDPGPVTGWSAADGAAPRAAAVAGTVACAGDGTSGKRVQILYARESQQADRLGQYRATFQQWAGQVDEAFRLGAEETGGYRRVRFVHDASCTPTVTGVVLPTGTLADFGRTFTALKAAGYGRSDRKYIVYAETTAWCGLGGGGPGAGDSRPGAENRYNSGPDLATTGTGCWGWAPTGHELLHTLGAVLGGAPHATENGHCWDDEDIMCYDDGGIPDPPGGLVNECPDAEENQFDCNHDDYYSTRPASGTWLASHWNVANSQFLITAPNLDFAAYPALADGATGAAVEAAEYLLQRVGFPPGPVDGIFDQATAAAVSSLRAARGLPAGSAVDSRVWTALLSAGSTPTLQNGSSGADVRRLQRSLTAALGRTIGIDGAFGSQTNRAARDYQSSRGLSADGIVGAKTWAALQAGK